MSPNRIPNSLRQHTGRLLRSTPPGSPRRSRPFPKAIRILHKCSSWSEPLFIPATDEGDDHDPDHTVGCPSPDSVGKGEWFYRMNTFNDVFFLSPSASRDNAGYEKDAKVVITVRVEGSPGPIRTLVKLGTTVEETVKLVILKYGEEGRLPRLDSNTPSSFDLHVSYFSFESLDKSSTIGDVGSRNFYLRKSNRKSREESLGTSEIVSIQGRSPKESDTTQMVVLPLFLSRKIGKFERRMRKVLKVLGCLQSV